MQLSERFVDAVVRNVIAPLLDKVCFTRSSAGNFYFITRP